MELNLCDLVKTKDAAPKKYNFSIANKNLNSKFDCNFRREKVAPQELTDHTYTLKNQQCLIS